MPGATRIARWAGRVAATRTAINHRAPTLSRWPRGGGGVYPARECAPLEALRKDSMGDSSKVQEKTQAALMALVSMYESVKEDVAADMRQRCVTVDVKSVDVVERWNTMAREHRIVADTLEQNGVPDELRVKAGPDYNRGGNLSEEQAAAMNAQRCTLLVQVIRRKAQSLEWMAARVVPGLVFRLSDDQAVALWGPVPELAAMLRTLSM